MNFIKKKLKGHKKDDEEEEYEKAVYEQSLHPQNQDQKMKNTEEWQFFQQLSMKVQDTVQKTQTTLNKLKDTRPEDGSNGEDKDFYDVDSDLLSKEAPVFGPPKVLRAPPRPPPPSGEKPSMPVDLGFGSDFSHSSPSKGPPRPPPPGSSEMFTLDSSALHETPSKSFGSPARPPPPNLAKTERTNVVDDFPPATQPSFSGTNQTQSNASFSLLDEFGFKSDPATTTTTNTNMQDLLFLDDKEDVDPFDTSFVDVNQIVSTEKKENVVQEKVSEKSFNPFCSSVASEDWMSSSPNHSDQAKKTVTNPFFSGGLEDVKSVSQDNVQSTPSHNPFSFNEPVSVDEKDDFFGLTINPSSSKDKLTDSFFQKNDSRKSSVDFECNQNFVNSAFSINEAEETETVIEPVSENVTSAFDSVQRKSIPNEIDMWDSSKEDSSIFKSGKVLGSTETSETSKASLLWDSKTLTTEVLQPEKSVPKDESVKMEDEIENNKATNDLDFFGSNNGTVNESLSNPEQPPPMENKTNEILQPDISKDLSDFSSVKEIETDAFSSSSLKENFHDKISEPSDIKPADQKADLEFDAFAAKFENAKENQGSDVFDPFMSKRAPTLKKIQENYKGFDSMDEFDPFRVTGKVENTQSMMKKEPSRDSFEDYDNEVDFSVVIKPKVKDSSEVKLPLMEPPKLLPPPKTPTKAFETPASRFNPFDKDFLENTEISKATEKAFEAVEVEDEPVPALGEAGVRKADSVDTPLSPLFDEDTSQPLEVFPKPYDKDGWEMVLRQPNKKKLTGNRFWKKIFVKLSENSVLQLFNKIDDKLPFQELPLQETIENILIGLLIGNSG
ncbi:protein stoned-B [Caerostris darwini]|uniref:Protein stoned-B n=1 Tax=Caerostris darwini TaxID=1538125 RepID=A0AAV4PT68_9ARAC|nr:protein stoned-B [Caerostris darwini]